MKKEKANSIPVLKLPDDNTIPTIGLGTFGSDRVSGDDVAKAVRGGIEAGYRLIDCASVYGNEDLIGKVFKSIMEEGVVTREELFVTSKVWNDAHDAVLPSLKKSLSDLQLDYVDAYFIHWPFRNYHAPGAAYDARNPDSKPFSADEFVETWEQLEAAHDAGLVKTLGVSNMTIPKLEAVLPRLRVKPTLIQMELHPAFQQPELFDYCIKHGIQPIGYSPLGSPSRPARDTTPDDVSAMHMPEIVKIAENHGIHPALVCLKWAVQRGQIPIPFSTNAERYASNLEAIKLPPLTDEEMAIIKKADANCRLIKGQVFLWDGATGWEDLWDLDGEIAGS